MKHNYLTLIATFFLLFSLASKAQIASFSFKTVTENGSYSPKHVLAVWVEKADGTFVKTLKLRGNTRKQWLLTWNAKTAGNVTDASTGSTISSHTSHVVNWNLRDLNGNLVPDGDYKIVVEYTDKHSQGPMFTINFTKNSSYSTQSPTNQAYFINMYFLFDPNATAVEKFSDDENALIVYPNPTNGKLNIKIEKSMIQSGNLQIMNLDGKIIYKQDVKNWEMNAMISIDLSNQASGVYFIVYKSDGQLIRKKVVIY